MCHIYQKHPCNVLFLIMLASCYIIPYRDIRGMSMAREGGIVVLPYGAAREDLIYTERLQSYVSKNLVD